MKKEHDISDTAPGRARLCAPFRLPAPVSALTPMTTSSQRDSLRAAFDDTGGNGRSSDHERHAAAEAAETVEHADDGQGGRHFTGKRESHMACQ